MRTEEIKKIKNEMIKSDKWFDEESEERILYEEMCCRSMIMSCLVYGHNIYASNYVKKYCDILGDERVFNLCKEQEEYFNNHVKVKINVYEDGENISYNSIEEY